MIRCRIGEDEARDRIRRRQLTQSTRAAHADAEHLAAPPPFTTLTLAVPSLDVDTTAGYRPELAAVVAFAADLSES